MIIDKNLKEGMPKEEINYEANVHPKGLPSHTQTVKDSLEDQHDKNSASDLDVPVKVSKKSNN